VGVATIQIRDLPDEVHDELTRQAEAAGQSLQKYMRERVIGIARSASRRSELLSAWEAELEASRPTVTRRQIIADLDEIRGA
jgi:plasmid stability protein